MGFFKSRETGESIRSVGAISTVGLSFVFAIVLGAWGGRVLDGWLGTGPVLFIAGFFVGLAAGVLNVYRTVSRVFPATRPTPPPAASAPPVADDRDGLGPSDE
jgi:ATP synthase protein I